MAAHYQRSAKTAQAKGINTMSSRQQKGGGCVSRALTTRQKETLKIIKETPVYVETAPDGRKVAINIRNDHLDMRTINSLVRRGLCSLSDDGWVPGARYAVSAA